MSLNDFILTLSISIFVFGFIIVLILLANLNSKIRLKKVNNLVSSVIVENSNYDSVTHTFFSELVKRSFDIITSVFLLIFVSPIFLLIFLIFKFYYKDKVIIKEKFIGRNGNEFFAYKFKTSNKDEISFSKFGLFLYKSSLDQLPLLVNVLNGKMSLVGRGLYFEEEISQLPKNIKSFILHEKPGLISLWIISWSKHNMATNEKVKFDIYYIKNRTFNLDVHIIIKAILLVLSTSSEF